MKPLYFTVLLTCSFAAPAFAGVNANAQRPNMATPAGVHLPGANTPERFHKKRYAHRPSVRRPIPTYSAHMNKLPLHGKIAPDITEALQNGNLSKAAQELFLNQSSERAHFLLGEIQRIGEDKSGLFPSGHEPHRRYLNLGVAYHNLYNFLHGQHITQKDFYKKALKYYRKAKGKAHGSHRTEVDCLIATLDMTAGKTKKAERRFAKVDVDVMEHTYPGLMYLSTYYAAAQQIDKTITSLSKAKSMDKAAVRRWIGMSDDYIAIRSNTTFQEFVKTLQ